MTLDEQAKDLADRVLALERDVESAQMPFDRLTHEGFTRRYHALCAERDKLQKLNQPENVTLN